jgi:hypothetical protein
MRKLLCVVVLASPLAACYYPPYSYYQVPCPPAYTPPPSASTSAGTVTPQPPAGEPPPAGTVTPLPPGSTPAPSGSAQTVTPTEPPETTTVYSGSTIQTNCVAPIANYTYGYYPGYYGPPVTGSFFVGGRFH